MKTTLGSALTPRAFDHWDKKLTFGNRVETQFLQTLAKRPLQLMDAIVPGNNIRIGRAINWVERRIGVLQESPYRYSPEFNRALVRFDQRSSWLTTIGAILPPVFFSAAHLIESGDLPFHALALSALWAISAFALSHFGTKTSRREMIAEHLETEKATLERKQVEEKLKSQALLLTSMINSVPGTLVFALDKNYRYLAFNENHRQEMKKVYGANIEIGQSMLDYINVPEVKPIAKASYDRVLNGESVIDIHQQPGLGIWYEFSWGPLRSSEGKISGINCFIKDVSEHKQMETEIRDSESNYRALVDNLNEGVWRIDREAKTSFVNDKMAQMLGYSAQEMMGKSLFEFMDEHGIRIAEQNVERRKQGIREQHEFEFIRKDGRRIYTLLETTPIFDEKGNYVGALAGILDITERKQAEATLRESEEIFNQFMENSPIYIYFKDENMRALRLSRNFEAMLGRPMAELLGKNTEELFPSESAKSMVADDRQILLEGKKVIIEEELNDRVYSTTKFPIQIEGKPRYLAGYTIDITERVQAEEATRKATIVAVNMERQAAVGKMVATLSHAVKNMILEAAGVIDQNNVALNRLMALFEVVIASRQSNFYRKTTLEEDALAQLKDLAKTSGLSGEAFKDMEMMVKNMLLFSRVGTEEPVVVPVKSGLQALEPVLTRVAMRKEVTVAFDIRGLSEEDGVRLPGNALQDIVRNLVNNAIEAYDGQAKRLPRQVEIIAKREENNQIKIVVEDKGAGIPADLLDKLSKAPIPSLKRGGTGLGLYSVRQITETAGGTMEIITEEGKGTKIIITLPRYVAAEIVAESKRIYMPLVSPETASQFTIMLIDDLPRVLSLTKDRLQRLGFNVEAFTDPKEAIAEFKKMPKKPDLVLTDETMLEMPGHELIKKLRRDPASGQSRFAVFSGIELPDDPADPLRKLVNGGVNYIQKGSDLERIDYEITRIFYSLINKKTPGAAASVSGGRKKEMDPLSFFLNRVVHDIKNNILAITLSLSLKIMVAENEGKARFLVDEDVIEAINDFRNGFRELRDFAARGGELKGIDDVRNGSIPESLVGLKLMEEVWEKVPAAERGKLAIIIALYLNNETIKLCDELDKFFSAPSFSLSEARQIQNIIDRFKHLNDAAMLRGEREDLIAKYKEYYRLLAISS